VLSNALFLAITANLMRAVDCTYDDDYPPSDKGRFLLVSALDKTPGIHCWQPDHIWLATLAMTSLSLYVFASAFIGIRTCVCVCVCVRVCVCAGVIALESGGLGRPGWVPF